MRLAYDAQADALSLILRDGAVESSREMAPGVIVNLDRHGQAVTIEVLDARTRLGKSGLSLIAIDLQDLYPESR